MLPRHYARWLFLTALLLSVPPVVFWGKPALRYAVHVAAHEARRYLPVRPSWIESHESAPEPATTAQHERAGFIVFERSVLERIHPDSHPRPDEIDPVLTLHATWDEREPAQLAVYPLRDLHRVLVKTTDLSDGTHVLPSSALDVRMERYYGASLSVRVTDRFGVVPKTLEPVSSLDIPFHKVRPYWITVHVPYLQPAGIYHGSIEFSEDGREHDGASIPLTVEVVPIRLEEPATLYGTLCVNALANLGKQKRVDRLLRQADLIFRDQREHSMNTMSLRSVPDYSETDDHPYLPDLEAAMNLQEKYRFPAPLVYCFGQLLNTDKIGRSNNYRKYKAPIEVPIASKVTAYYTRRFIERGLPAPIFIPVEEPSVTLGVGRHDPPEIRSKIAAQLVRAVHAAGGATALTCTQESVHAIGEHVDYWIAAFRRFTPELYRAADKADSKLCIYANATMMGQGTYFSRFMFGYFVWANDIKGMLPWTYPLTPKRFPRNVGNRGEGPMNVSEGFLGTDGKPIPTIQWELSREGIDDAKYMVTIQLLAQEARRRGAAAALEAADVADAFLAEIRHSVVRDAHRYVFEDDKTFEPVPVDVWDAARFKTLHERAVEILKSLLAVTA